MLRCREGDQAIVLAGPYIGFIVKVGKFVGDSAGTDLHGISGYYSNLWWVHNRDIEREVGINPTQAPDDYLQPIRGPKTGQTTTTEKEIGA